MRSQLSFFLMVVLASSGQTVALVKSEPVPRFRLQVASFPDKVQAERCAIGLVKAGETPVFDTVEIAGRGFWTRVFVGLFNTTDEARQYGITLVARGITKEFLVKETESIEALTRPRRVITSESQVSNHIGSAGLRAKPKAAVADKSGSGSRIDNAAATGLRHEKPQSVNDQRALPQRSLRYPLGSQLPVVELAAFKLAPRVNTSLLPRPDPVGLAFRLVTGEVRQAPGTPGHRGGLWVSGDAAEGLTRLRWIVGVENARLIKLDSDGRVRVDTNLLSKLAGSGATRVQDPLQVVKYVASNEGLLLLVQMTQGCHRYLLHFGRNAPTYGRSVDTSGSLNLDNNVDSRINPYRKNGKKLDAERPPDGFDSLIALNPVARWFNLNTNGWVHGGEIVFHELAEAYAKLEFNLDYLDQGSRPGAHAVALSREQRLKSQRPSADIVITEGSNRLLRTEAEIRLFTAEASAGANQR